MILHVDLNSFYASCAVATSNGKYQFDSKLMVCGSSETRHGIVLAATYPVKKHGIRAGMPTREALLRCPDAVIVPPDYATYVAYSERFMGIVQCYSPAIMRYGIDEAYLDYTGCEHLFGPPMAAANLIRERVKRELGLTVSVGVGDNLLMAKMGSDYKKPDAVTRISRDNWRELIWPMGVENLMYVGKSTAEKLRSMGVKTVGQLAAVDARLLQARFGKSGEELWRHANGIDEARISGEEQPQKGIGNSETLPKSLHTLRQVTDALLVQTDKVAYRLRCAGLYAGVVGVHLRFDDLSGKGKQMKLPRQTNLTETLFSAVKELAKSLYAGQSVRQVGMRVGMLTAEGEQLSLLGADREEKLHRLDAATDLIRGRYGAGALMRGSSMAFDRETHAEFTPFVKS